jgi:thioredoxin reductase (NADPH)
VTVVDAGALGGKLYEYEALPIVAGYQEPLSGDGLATTLLGRLADCGGRYVAARVTGVLRSDDCIRVDLEDGPPLAADNVVLAVGTRRRLPSVGGGDAALDPLFLSHCVACDAPLWRGRPVALVGLDEPLQRDLAIARRYAAPVYLVTPPDAAIPAMLAGDSSIQHVRGSLHAVSGQPGQVEVVIGGIDGLQTLRVAAIVPTSGYVPNTEFLDRAMLDTAGLILVRNNSIDGWEGLWATGTCAAPSGIRSPVDSLADGWLTAARVLAHAVTAN